MKLAHKIYNEIINKLRKAEGIPVIDIKSIVLLKEEIERECSVKEGREMAMCYEEGSRMIDNITREYEEAVARISRDIIKSAQRIGLMQDELEEIVKKMENEVMKVVSKGNSERIYSTEARPYLKLKGIYG